MLSWLGPDGIGFGSLTAQGVPTVAGVAGVGSRTGQDGDGHGAGVVADGTSAVLRKRQAGPVDLAVAGAAAQLGGQLDQLGHAGGTDGMALAQQPATRIDRDPSAEVGVAGLEQLDALARTAQPE